MNDQLCNLGRRANLRGRAGLILIVLTGQLVAHPSSAYLPAVGPAPLRFEAVPAPGAAEAWKLVLLAQKAALAAMATNATNVAVSTPIPAANTNAANLVTLPVVSLPDETNSETVPDATVLPPLGEDTFDPSTPQAWADFFKPGAGGRFAGPRTEEPRFVPPAPKSAKENGAGNPTK